MKIIILLSLICRLLFAQNYFYKNGKRVEIIPQDSISQIRNINKKSDIKYYKIVDQNSDDITIGIDSKIIVKFKKQISGDIVFKRYGYRVIKEYSNGVFVLEANSVNQSLKIANELFESGVVVYATPNIHKKIFLR